MSSCPFVFDHGPWHNNTLDSGLRSVLFVSLNFSMFQIDAHALSFYAARARRNSYDQIKLTFLHRASALSYSCSISSVECDRSLYTFIIKWPTQ